jgi:hypothetical protein
MELEWAKVAAGSSSSEIEAPIDAFGGMSIKAISEKSK